MLEYQGKSLSVGAVVGSGIATHAAQLGGADFILAINAGRLRNMGAPSIACVLPTHDAVALSYEVALEEILPHAQVPVFLGMNDWSSMQDRQQYLGEIKDAGFAGVVNFPPAMLLSQEMKAVGHAFGLTYEGEIALLLAAQKAGLQTLFYCGSDQEAAAAAKAGLPNILYNFGWNVGGLIGHQAHMSLEEAGAVARRIGRLIKHINPAAMFYLEGGPINTAEDLAVVKRFAPVDGYVGGSTLDRVPFERAVADRIADYKHAGYDDRELSEGEKNLLHWSRQFGFIGNSPKLLAFLRRLREFRKGHHPLAIRLESGQDSRPIIKALQKQSGARTRFLDIKEEAVSTLVLQRLFGSYQHNRVSFGLLTDSGVDVIILKNIHLLPKIAQRRLAVRITRGELPHPRTRAPLPITARMVFLETPDVWESERYQAELRGLCDGWRLAYPAIRHRNLDLLKIMTHRAKALKLDVFEHLHFSTAVLQILRGHLWNGNDAEIDAFLGALTGSGHRGEITPDHIRQLLSKDKAAAQEILDEKARLLNALWRNGFHRGRTAELLGISRKTLYNKMQKYDL